MILAFLYGFGLGVVDGRFAGSGDAAPPVKIERRVTGLPWTLRFGGCPACLKRDSLKNPFFEARMPERGIVLPKSEKCV